MSYKVNIQKLPKSEVELKGSINAPLLEVARKKAIKKFSENLELSGFRKGHIPEKIIIEKVGEHKLLEEAAEILLNEYYPKMLADEKIDSIGRPKVSITKLALGNPLEFTIKSAVLPHFDLPDYKAIALSVVALVREDEKIEVSEKEVDDVIHQIRKNKAHHDWHRDHKTNHEQGGKQNYHDHPDFEKEENLPKLDDEFAKQAGSFANIKELEEKVKDNIVGEKKRKDQEKQRAAVMEELLKNTKIDLPEILIESEIDKSLAQLKDEIQRIGGKFEDYLKETKKSEVDLRKDLLDGAEKKAKVQLIFNKIAETEKLEPNREILEHEVSGILEHYPEANKENVRIYVATQLLNQEVLKLLERPR